MAAEIEPRERRCFFFFCQWYRHTQRKRTASSPTISCSITELQGTLVSRRCCKPTYWMNLSRQAASLRRRNSLHHLQKKKKCNNFITAFCLEVRTFAITINTKHTLIAVYAFPAFTTPPYPPQYCFGHLTNRGLKYQSDSRKIKMEILKIRPNDARNSW